MNQREAFKQIVFVVLIALLGAAARLFSFIPNVTPVAAMALFGGAMLPKRWMSLTFPLLILFLSDAIIGFYSIVLMIFVYVAFLLVALLGMWLKSKLTLGRVVLFSITGSIIFFLVSNFGVWVEGLWYPMTWQGFVECCVMAIPFFRYELLGTLGYSLVFFGLYECVRRYVLVSKTI
jgi:hypothetical protein